MTLIGEKKHICFIVPYCYPLFNPEIRTMFGGWEVRISQIARELAKLPKYEVSILVADHGQPHHEIRDNVHLISWVGMRFWGIPEPKPNNNPQSGPIIPGESLTKTTTSQVGNGNPYGFGQTIVHEEMVTPPVQKYSIPGSKPRINSGWRSTKRKIIPIYKKVINWRTRVFLSGLFRGFYYSTKHFWALIKSIGKKFFTALKEVISSTFDAIRTSNRMFREYFINNYSIAKNAIGNIYEEPVFPEAIEIFKDINADVFIVPGNTRISAHVSVYCRKWKRLFIMLAGSDMDFDPIFVSEPDQVDIYGSPHYVKLFVIKNAHAHIVQNELQAERAKRFGVRPIIIKNPIGLEREFSKNETAQKILWVGNTDERVKRPSILLKTARALSQFEFVMIVTPSIQVDYDRLVENAKDIPNLHITSLIPYDQIEKYFAEAKLFISTSKFEGFPNTFLQSGKYGIPVVSLNVNPNEMLTEAGCGFFCADDQDLFVHKIIELMSNQLLYSEISQSILAYVTKHHDRKQIITEYDELFTKLLLKKDKGR